jgi:hypothetical protein
MKNVEVKVALDCMAVLCGPLNRLPTLAALKADRTLRALRSAYEPVEAIRIKLVEEHGEKAGEETKVPDANLPAFIAAYNELMGAETDVTIQPIRTADVQAGYSRDPATGKKDIIDISPAQLGVLVELGIITEEAA